MTKGKGFFSSSLTPTTCRCIVDFAIALLAGLVVAALEKLV